MAVNKQFIVNGVEYGSITDSQLVIKLKNMLELVPHKFKSTNHTPTKYESYIVTVINADIGEEYAVYMPKHVIDKVLPGKRFVYAGKAEKMDGSGHFYHRVEWEKCD